MKVYKNVNLAIHGGAGALAPEKYTKEELAEYESLMREILERGKNLYEKGEGALTIACECVGIMEDSPLFNAARGSVFDAKGTIQMDASLMCGKTRRVGGASLLETVQNPIFLAREVLESSSHSLLAGEGAEEFARERGLNFQPHEYFWTQKRHNQLLKAKEKQLLELDHGDTTGTVGAVARDKSGNLAAATSTGGMTNKHHGRVSDSSIIGAGTYADNRTCAISGTGTGDQFIQNVFCYDIHAQMFYQNKTLSDSVSTTLESLKDVGGSGGLAALTGTGHCILPFNTRGMFRGHLTQTGELKTAIFNTNDEKSGGTF